MDWKSIVGAAAPLLGAALAGPAGGAALSLLASKFGGSPADPAALASAIAADPEAAAKLREIEAAHQTELFRLSIADVQDARVRELGMAAAGRRDVAVPLLAGLVVAGFFTLTGVMMFYPLPEASLGPVNQLFGALVAGFASVLGYYFGSSAGSKSKDELLVKK